MLGKEAQKAKKRKEEKRREKTRRGNKLKIALNSLKRHHKPKENKNHARKTTPHRLKDKTTRICLISQ